jgi:hypothetical protein
VKNENGRRALSEREPQSTKELGLSDERLSELDHRSSDYRALAHKPQGISNNSWGGPPMEQLEVLKGLVVACLTGRTSLPDQ